MAIKDPRRFQNKTDPSLRKNTGNKDAIPEIWSSITQKASKAIQDGLRGAFTQPEPQGESKESPNGNGYTAGQAPKPTMYGQAFAGTALDPRYVLTESILGSIANLYQVSFSGFPIPDTCSI